MANVNTGELLDFQDYSPDHNNRSARIDVEAVHTNQYNNTMSNPNYNFEEPKAIDEPEAAPQKNHNFWTIEYYQKYFDVHTNEVVERIISSVLPQKVSHNYFDERIKGKPDLYGPVWISVTLYWAEKKCGLKKQCAEVSASMRRTGGGTADNLPTLSALDNRLVAVMGGQEFATGDARWTVNPFPQSIFTIAVSGNIASYLHNANTKGFVWRYDFHLVSIAATAITCYVWLVPLALWAALKWTSNTDGHDEIENQDSKSPSMMSLFCLYGYSLSIYIPVAVLWTIQVFWLQWLFVLMAAFVSGAVLIFWLMPALRKSKYFVILIGCILGFHFLLAAGFMLYFFHQPEVIVPSTLKPLAP